MFSVIWLTIRVFWVKIECFESWIECLKPSGWCFLYFPFSAFSVFSMFYRFCQLTPCSPIRDGRLEKIVDPWIQVYQVVNMVRLVTRAANTCWHRSHQSCDRGGRLWAHPACLTEFVTKILVFTFRLCPENKLWQETKFKILTSFSF